MRLAAPFMPPSTRMGAHAACPITFGSFWNEGPGHRRGRFHRIAPATALLDRGTTVSGYRLLHRLLPARAEGSEPDALKGRPGFSFTEAALQDVDLKALLTGVTHVFHLAGQAGVRKSWGGDFDVYIRDNIHATQRLLEAVARMPIQNMSTRRALRSTAITCRCPCAKTRICSRCRHTA